MGLNPILHRIDIRLHDHKATPGLDHPATGNQALSLRWGEQVDFHLGGQHLGPVGHQAERGIARCTVTNGKGQTGMAKAVLLPAAGQNGGLDHRGPVWRR